MIYAFFLTRVKTVQTTNLIDAITELTSRSLTINYIILETFLSSIIFYLSTSSIGSSLLTGESWLARFIKLDGIPPPGVNPLKFVWPLMVRLRPIYNLNW